MTGFPAEMELLRASLRAHVVGSESTEDLAPLLSRVNWPHVLWLGRQHRVLLFLHATLKAPALAGLIPPGIVAQLAALGEVSQLRSLARARELCLLQDLFDRHGIPALPLDSWLLAWANGIAPGLVELGTSLRYVVPAPHQARAMTALHDAGHPTVADPQKLILKDRSPVLLYSRFAATAPAARLRANSRPLTVGGRSLPALSPLHWLLERVAQCRPDRTPSPFVAWELVRLAGNLDAADWSLAGAEAAALGLPPHWTGTVAASFDALGVPRPSALNDVPTPPPVASGPAVVELEQAPFLPTPPGVMRRMLELAGTGPADVVCDLGCGDGRLVVSAAKEFGARSVGVDLDPVRIAEATARAAAGGVTERVKLICGDLFAQDLSQVSVLCLYLLPGFYPRIREKLRREARPGTRVVSHDYIFPGWPPEKTEIVRAGPLKVSQIYLWRLG